MDGRVDVGRLYEALDAERRARSLTWKQVGQGAEVSPSLLSRMGKGYRPDLESFAALVQWLKVPAETFYNKVEDSSQIEGAAFETRLLPLLRAEKDLSDKDREYIMAMVSATMRYLKDENQNR